MSQKRTRAAQKQLNTTEIISRQVIPSAIFAPSAHNTQPWKFRIEEGKIDVFVDWDRHLEISDPSQRQLYISIGCALANIQVAARFWDYVTDIQLLPAGNHPEQPAATVTLKKSPAPTEKSEEMFTAIEARHTDRTLYDVKPLTGKQRQALPTLGHASVTVIDDPSKIRQVAQLAADATRATLSEPDFKRELSHWIRNNWTRQPDGMPGYANDIPGPISLIAPIIVRLAPIHRQEAPKMLEQVTHSSALAIIGSTTDSPRDWLEAGRLMEMLWLEATAAGLAAMPVAAPIEAKDPALRRRLAKYAAPHQLPHAMLRLGHSRKQNVRATPRRSLDDCLEE